MIVAQLFFSLMVVCVKLARVELSGVEVVLWRALGSLPILWWLCRGGSWRVSVSGALLCRVVFGFAAMSSFYIAAKSLAVADLSMLSKADAHFGCSGSSNDLGGRGASDQICGG